MQSTALETLVAASPADSVRWRALVSESPFSDIYYLPEYARANAEIESSEPVAVVAGREPCRYLAPLLIRRMSAGVDGSRIDWTDACSPYGYGGLLPLSNQPGEPRGLDYFLDDLHDWCRAHRITACVLRLHPLMRQDEWFEPEGRGFFRKRSRGPTVAIDLTNWDDARNRPRGLPKDRRWDLNRASRDLHVTWTRGDDPDVESNLERFIAMYHEAMEHRHADSFYKFPPAYFSRLASLGPSLGIAFAWLDEHLAAANIFLAGRDYSHFHLAAGNDIGMAYGAATLLIVEGARWARAKGCKLSHLGGGLRAGDTLEQFKWSLGSLFYRYAYLVSATDPERYEQLCRIPNAPWPYCAEPS
jgi:hypothetical protein